MADNETYDYQGEDESVNDYQTSGGSLNDIPPPQGGSSMGSRLIIILVFMIIAYAIGYFLTNMSGSTNTAPVQEVPSPIVPQQQPQPAPPPPVQTKEFKLEDSVVFKNFQKQSQQQVDQLKSLNTQLVQQVKQMNDQVLAVQESVANESFLGTVQIALARFTTVGVGSSFLSSSLLGSYIVIGKLIWLEYLSTMVCNR